MSGMDARTGRAIAGMPHIRQSIADILTTRIGTRVMRREYGSLLPELIDHPANPANLLRMQAASIMAILRWEPRVRVTRISFGYDASGRAVLEMDAVRVDGPRAGQPVSLTIRMPRP
jgi:hypothetical protein